MGDIELLLPLKLALYRCFDSLASSSGLGNGLALTSITIFVCVNYKLHTVPKRGSNCPHLQWINLPSVTNIAQTIILQLAIQIFAALIHAATQCRRIKLRHPFNLQEIYTGYNFYNNAERSLKKRESFVEQLRQNYNLQTRRAPA